MVSGPDTRQKSVLKVPLWPVVGGRAFTDIFFI